MGSQYHDLYEKLGRLQWLLQRYHKQNCAGHGPFADITRGQGRVLAMLRIKPDVSTKELSYLLGIRRQSLNELLNKLEKGGYIYRTQSEEDKRVMIIHLTEKGKNQQEGNHDHGDAFHCLDRDEQALLGQYLDRVIGSLEGKFHGQEKESMMKWLRDARWRMGEEEFQRFMSMRKKGKGGDGGDSKKN